jgi:hypothetical protein
MAAPIGPGDWVECVDARQRPEAPLPPLGLTVGKLYLVEGVGEWGGFLGVVLRDVRSWHPSGGYRADHFRPIYRPKADLIEQLKAPPKTAPVKITEAA